MTTITGLVQGMGSIFLTWALFGAIFTGVGSLAYRVTGSTLTRTKDVFLCFWSGWAVTIIYLQIWHLFWRVDTLVLVVPVLAGAWGWLRNGRHLAAIVGRNIARYRIAALLLGAVALWTANHALTPLSEYDAGLYHLSTVRWENTYPIVAGLGNLSWPLALNTSAFLYMAMLNVSPWAGKAYVFADSLLLVVFLSQLTISAVRICRRGKVAHLTPSDKFLALLIVPTVTYIFALAAGVASMNYDIIVFILQVLVSTQLLDMLVARQENAREAGARLLFITLLAVTGIAVKITFIVLGGAAIIIAAVLVARVWTRTRTLDRRIAALLVAIVALSMGPWLVRGIILSGYPAYPAALFALPVDWRMPLATVKANDAVMVGWARIPGPHWQEAVGNWHWLQPWFAHTSQDYLIPLVVAIALGALAPAIAWYGHARGDDKLPPVTWLFLVPAALGVLAWFLTAPDPRYASALFWIMAAGAATITIPLTAWPARSTPLVFAMLLAIAQQPTAVHSALTLDSPGPIGGLYNLPTVPLKTITLPSGFKIYTPAQGDQVWDAPLPSAPPTYVLPQLHSRCMGTLRCGFRASQ